METKLILKNFWFLIIGIPVGFYYFFHYNSYNSLVSAIIITLFIIALKLIKNYKQLKIAIGIFLSTLAVWQISNQIIEGSFNLYKLITAISCLVIMFIVLSKKGTKKIEEIRGNSKVQNIAVFGMSIFVCYIFIKQDPNDFLEYLTVVVSGTFAVITGWFLFYDVNKN